MSSCSFMCYVYKLADAEEGCFFAEKKEGNICLRQQPCRSQPKHHSFAQLGRGGGAELPHASRPTHNSGVNF
uniref:Uncharacterized protein n=1 Tax=Oryzias latipes TaxID=8090 RepID=A0A3P9IWW0_ORYLA